MRYGERFIDDLASRPIDAPPISLPGLLNHLGVRRADQATQDAAIRAWLVDHEPDHPTLRWELERRGYLKSATA